MYGAGRDDDGLSPLDARRYLAIRITDQLAYYHGRVRALNRSSKACRYSPSLQRPGGAILAAAGFEVSIELTSGAAAAALAYLGYLQMDHAVVTYNQAAAKLTGLQREWQASNSGQRDATAVTNFVTRSETVLARAHPAGASADERSRERPPGQTEGEGRTRFSA